MHNEYMIIHLNNNQEKCDNGLIVLLFSSEACCSEPDLCVNVTEFVNMVVDMMPAQQDLKKGF